MSESSEYTLHRVEPGVYEIAHGGRIVGHLSRDRGGWLAELPPKQIPCLPAPFTSHRHRFPMLVNALVWLGNPPRKERVEDGGVMAETASAAVQVQAWRVSRVAWDHGAGGATQAMTRLVLRVRERLGAGGRPAADRKLVGAARALAIPPSRADSAAFRAPIGSISHRLLIHIGACLKTPWTAERRERSG